MTYRIQFAGLIAALGMASAVAAQDAKSPSERGALAVRGHPAMNPPLWSFNAYDNVWKQWGLAEKPADYPRAVRERYGLHAASYDNSGLPMGLHVSQGLFGKGIINDCLMCHAGKVAGQTILGAGNSATPPCRRCTTCSTPRPGPRSSRARIGPKRTTTTSSVSA